MKTNPRTELTNLLREALENTFARTRFASAGRDPSEADRGFGTTLALEQVRLMLERARAVRRPRFTQDEAMLDRVLQKWSRHYLVTRRLGARLGVGFDPRVTPAGPIYYLRWDPGHPTLAYSPLESRVHRLLSKRGGPDPAIWPRFEKLRRHLRPIYHELNHHVIFRILRPAADVEPTPARIRQYYALVESLVIFRDIVIAEEFGQLVWPFIHGGALYYGLKDGAKPLHREVSFEFFATCLLHMQWQVLGHRSEEIERFFRKAGRKFVWHPYFKEFNDETFELHRNWFRRYERKYGARFRLPPPARDARLRLELRTVAPEELIRDTAELKRIYRWYRKVFAPGSAPRGSR